MQIAWVGRASNSYVPYFNESGAPGAVWAQIGTLTVTRPAAFPDPAALPMDVRQPTEVAPGVYAARLGCAAAVDSPRRDAAADALLAGAAETARPAFTLQALLRGDQAQTRSLWTGQPIDDRYPADQWAEGEVLADRVRWTIPRDQAAGRLRR